MTLPKIPDGKDWSPETWRAGLDKAVRLSTLGYSGWGDLSLIYHEGTAMAKLIIAHATTLIEAGIVKPVVSEAAVALLKEIDGLRALVNGREPTLKAIQSALDKARAGG